jgi:tetratricopeptide (TPR) repeat protein
LDPTKGDVYLSRGIAEEKLFQWEAAVADYKLANERYRASSFPFPRDDPTAISNLANAETGLLQWQDAYRDFAKAASMNSDFLAPQIGKALVAYELGRPAETLAFFESLAGKYPTYADANAVLATLYFEGALYSDPTVPLCPALVTLSHVWCVRFFPRRAGGRGEGAVGDGVAGGLEVGTRALPRSFSHRCRVTLDIPRLVFVGTRTSIGSGTFGGGRRSW